MARPGQKRSDSGPVKTAAYLKRQQVLQYKSAGLTFTRIADLVGYTNASAASKAFKTALKEAACDADTIAELRTIELLRANEHYRRVSEYLGRSIPVLYQGNPVMVRNAQGQEVVLEDVGVKLDAIRTALAIQKRIADLFGLDAAVKYAGDPDGAPITIEVIQAAIMAKHAHLRDVATGALAMGPASALMPGTASDN